MKAAAIAAAALSLAGAARPAFADVLEVGVGGVVTVRPSDGGVITVADAGDRTVEDAPDTPSDALTTLDAPMVPVGYEAALAQAATTTRLSPALLSALVWQESRWRAGAVSPKGARGLTQLMPGTARALAVDPADATANLAGGARYLRSLLDQFNGDVERALAAYNAGPGRVLRAGGIPAITETRLYVSSILDRVAGAGATVLQGVKP